jgi:hypothetical protein
VLDLGAAPAITFSMLASRLISAAVAGEKDPDARLFRFR